MSRKWYFMVVLICIFLLVRDVQNLYICLLVWYFYVFSVETYTKIIINLLYYCFSVVFSNILNIKLSSDAWFEIFSQSMTFNSQFLKFINPIYFLFYCLYFGWYRNKVLSTQCQDAFFEKFDSFCCAVYGACRILCVYAHTKSCTFSTYRLCSFCVFVSLFLELIALFGWKPTKGLVWDSCCIVCPLL